MIVKPQVPSSLLFNRLFAFAVLQHGLLGSAVPLLLDLKAAIEAGQLLPVQLTHGHSADLYYSDPFYLYVCPQFVVLKKGFSWVGASLETETVYGFAYARGQHTRFVSEPLYAHPRVLPQ
jgi:hypothetical protein